MLEYNPNTVWVAYYEPRGAKNCVHNRDFILSECKFNFDFNK